MADQIKPGLVVTLVVLGLLLAGCGPEASRTRGGAQGGDIGNRHLGASTLEIHGTTVPSYQEPLRGQAIEKIKQETNP
ncbi:MAG: hypothetical protein M5U01_18480 [Ardenticatenaceae bacterium]|nr:hypothetical protein [Ardenticatenaceae bacterium]HBY94520.1 hypothetical protein [Chloroflexota bacterium]